MNHFDSPTVTIDDVIFQLIDGTLKVLLVERTHEPFKGTWALPGGYVTSKETSMAALRRTLEAKTSIPHEKIDYIEQLYTFDTPGLHGGNAISLTYLMLTRGVESHQTAAQKFFGVKDLPELAYEHGYIVHYAYQRLQHKILYSNVAFALLSPRFTLSDLQSAYEEILDQKLDKRNFRKKFLQLDLIEPTEHYQKDGAHRPAKLYRFKQQKLVALSRSFN